MSSWHSYPKIYNVGHRALADFFREDVYVEEKVDGSQFSFGVFDGELKCRSKGQQLVVDAPEKMFTEAVATAKSLVRLLVNGWTYRAEYLKSPKHNTLKYDRIPASHLILFDVCTGEEQYLHPADKARIAQGLGLECVPVLGEGKIGLEALREFMDYQSVLGGTKVEGVVCKRFPSQLIFGEDKKALIAKHVSEAFKEVHGKEWKKLNPTGKDFVGALAERFHAEGRWAKALQHLRDAGKLTNSPQDIPALMAEIRADIRSECMDEITVELLRYAMPQIDRAATRGVPDWYKARLLESQFSEAGAAK